ncbi:MAG: 50S ribosomal protein L29 [bacterium]|nr:50S ribosomal protein L29 [bacterium]
MLAKDIRKLTEDEINKKILEFKEELFNLKLRQATGDLEKTARINSLRKDIARLKTVLNERKNESK